MRLRCEGEGECGRYGNEEHTPARRGSAIALKAKKDRTGTSSCTTVHIPEGVIIIKSPTGESVLVACRKYAARKLPELRHDHDSASRNDETRLNA